MNGWLTINYRAMLPWYPSISPILLAVIVNLSGARWLREARQLVEAYTAFKKRIGVYI